MCDDCVIPVCGSINMESYGNDSSLLRVSVGRMTHLSEMCHPHCCWVLFANVLFKHFAIMFLRLALIFFMLHLCGFCYVLIMSQNAFGCTPCFPVLQNILSKNFTSLSYDNESQVFWKADWPGWLDDPVRKVFATRATSMSLIPRTHGGRSGAMAQAYNLSLDRERQVDYYGSLASPT